MAGKISKLNYRFFLIGAATLLILFLPKLIAQAQCASLACEGTNLTLPCACGAATANNANRWCCAANNAVYPTKSQCEVGTCAPLCLSTACEQANTVPTCRCGTVNTDVNNRWCCAATNTVHPDSGTCCGNAACADADADGQDSLSCNGKDCDDNDLTVFNDPTGVKESEGVAGTCDDVKDNDCDNMTDRCNDPDCYCAGGIVPCGRHSDDPTTAILENSPCSPCHFFVIVKRIVDMLLISVFAPLLALFLIGAGVSLITASGNAEGIKKGKDFLKAVGIGAIIVIAGWLLIESAVMAIVPNSRIWRDWKKLSCPVAPCDDATADPTDDDAICEINLGEDAQNCPTDCPCDFDDVCDPVKEQIGGGNPEACPDCAVCGNGIVDTGEYCDLGNFRGGVTICAAFGYKSGNLTCTSDCQIDFNGCQ